MKTLSVCPCPSVGPFALCSSYMLHGARVVKIFQTSHSHKSFTFTSLSVSWTRL